MIMKPKIPDPVIEIFFPNDFIEAVKLENIIKDLIDEGRYNVSELVLLLFRINIRFKSQYER